MSDTPQKTTLEPPKVTSSRLFSVQSQSVAPVNNPQKAYYEQNDSLVFQIGGNSAEFMVGDSAMLSFCGKVFGKANWDIGTAWDGTSTNGLPRFDYGCGFFQSCQVSLDNSNVVTSDNGSDNCRTFYNSKLACSPYTPVTNVMDVGELDGAPGQGMHRITSKDCGLLKMSGFASDAVRIQSFCGPYRANTNAPPYTPVNPDGRKWLNGALPYRFPMSMWAGVFDSRSSAWVPLGMLSQQSANAITCRFKLAPGTDCTVSGYGGQSIALGGTIPTSVGQEMDPVTPYGIFSPKITYKSVTIHSQLILDYLQLAFMGEAGVDVPFGDAFAHIPRHLLIKTPSHQIHSWVHPAGARRSTFNIPASMVSLNGMILRFVKTPSQITSASFSKAVDYNSAESRPLVVGVSFKIGSKTYPLQEIRSDGGDVPDASLDVTQPSALTDLLRNQMTSDSEAELSVYSLESRGIFSPYREYGFASVLEDGWSSSASQCSTVWPLLRERNQIKPYSFSLENRSSSLDVQTHVNDGATAMAGLDTRGLSLSVTVDLQMPSSVGSLLPPSDAVTCVLGLAYDNIISIKSGKIDVSAEYALIK